MRRCLSFVRTQAVRAEASRKRSTSRGAMLGDSALASDEAIAAVIEHECYELTRVRRLRAESALAEMAEDPIEALAR